MNQVILAFLTVSMIFQSVQFVIIAHGIGDIKQNQKEILFQIVNRD